MADVVRGWPPLTAALDWPVGETEAVGNWREGLVRVRLAAEDFAFEVGLLLLALYVFVPYYGLALAAPKYTADLIDALISWAHDDWR